MCGQCTVSASRLTSPPTSLLSPSSPLLRCVPAPRHRRDPGGKEDGGGNEGTRERGDEGTRGRGDEGSRRGGEEGRGETERGCELGVRIGGWKGNQC
eukprot:2120193-Rhodomonas_salina.1